MDGHGPVVKFQIFQPSQWIMFNILNMCVLVESKHNKQMIYNGENPNYYHVNLLREYQDKHRNNSNIKLLMVDVDNTGFEQEFEYYADVIYQGWLRRIKTEIDGLNIPSLIHSQITSNITEKRETIRISSNLAIYPEISLEGTFLNEDWQDLSAINQVLKAMIHDEINVKRHPWKDNDWFYQ